MVKNLHAKAGDTGNESLIPGSGRFFEVGKGNPPQDSCLENPMARGVRRAIVQGVAGSAQLKQLGLSLIH